MLMSGIAVPEQIALIGYDDIPFAGSAVVPISSIRQPARLIGRTAVELLEDEVEQGPEAEHRDILFSPERVVRRSTTGRDEDAGAAGPRS